MNGCGPFTKEGGSPGQTSCVGVTKAPNKEQLRLPTRGFLWMCEDGFMRVERDGRCKDVSGGGILFFGLLLRDLHISDLVLLLLLCHLLLCRVHEFMKMDGGSRMEGRCCLTSRTR